MSEPKAKVRRVLQAGSEFQILAPGCVGRTETQVTVPPAFCREAPGGMFSEALAREWFENTWCHACGLRPVFVQAVPGRVAEEGTAYDPGIPPPERIHARVRELERRCDEMNAEIKRVVGDLAQAQFEIGKLQRALDYVGSALDGQGEQ